MTNVHDRFHNYIYDYGARKMLAPSICRTVPSNFTVVTTRLDVQIGLSYSKQN